MALPALWLGTCRAAAHDVAYRVLIVLALLLFLQPPPSVSASSKNAKGALVVKKSTKGKPSVRSTKTLPNRRGATQVRPLRTSIAPSFGHEVRVAFADLPQLKRIERMFSLPNTQLEGEKMSAGVKARIRKINKKGNSENVFEAESKDGLRRIRRSYSQSGEDITVVTETEPIGTPGSKGFYPETYQAVTIRAPRTRQTRFDIDRAINGAGGFELESRGAQEVALGFTVGKRPDSTTQLIQKLLPGRVKTGDVLELRMQRDGEGRLGLDVNINGSGWYSYTMIREAKSTVFRLNAQPPATREAWSAPDPVTNAN